MAKKKTTKRAAKKKSVETIPLDLTAFQRPLWPQEFFPLRNDVLNFYLGGGLPLGTINEFAGDPGMFKTTTLVELVVDWLNSKKWPGLQPVAVVYDREERIKESRISMLGGNPEHSRLILHTNQPHLLTVEFVFERTTEIMNKVRGHDLERVKVQLRELDGDHEMVAFYRHAVGSSKKTGEGVATDLKHYHTLLRPQDKTPVLVVVDSITATPTEMVLEKDIKSLSKVELAREMQMRENHITSKQPGTEARAWSAAFRNCTWLDERVLVAESAQVRMTNLMTNARSQAAVSSAHRFYGRTRLFVHPVKQGGLYKDPDSGNILMGAQKLSEDQKLHRVGQILGWRIDKSVVGVLTDVPAFMLGDYGTDRVNTFFEWMRNTEIIKANGPTYSVNEDRLKQSELELGFPMKFTRAKFVNELYAAHLSDWAALARWYVQTVAGVTK